jgi:hypothetical protein
MAARSGIRSAHATAAAAAEDVITLSGGGGQTADIVNTGATNTLYYRLDNVAAVALAAETYVVRPNERVRVNLAANGIVRLISTSGTTYSVQLV